MRTVFLVALVVNFYLCNGFYVQISPQETQCIEDLKLNRTAILGFQSVEIKPLHNEEYNQFLGCLYKKRNITGEKGDLVISELKKWLNSSSLLSFQYKTLETVYGKCFDAIESNSKLPLAEVESCIRNNHYYHTYGYYPRKRYED